MGADSTDCLLENSLSFSVFLLFHGSHFLVFCCFYSPWFRSCKGKSHLEIWIFSYHDFFSGFFSEWVMLSWDGFAFVIKWKIMTANQFAFWWIPLYYSTGFCCISSFLVLLFLILLFLQVMLEWDIDK